VRIPPIVSAKVGIVIAQIGERDHRSEPSDESVVAGAGPDGVAEIRLGDARLNVAGRSRVVSVFCKLLSGTARLIRRPRERTTTMFTIDNTIEIAVPHARVLAAIATESGYRAWCSQDTDFDGKQMTLGFAVPGAPRSVSFQVDRCDGSGIVMTCIGHENNPDWLGTTLAIELGETPTGTRVHLVHSGYRAKNEVYERSIAGWAHFLRSLSSYMITGTGEPYPKAA